MFERFRWTNALERARARVAVSLTYSHVTEPSTRLIGINYKGFRIERVNQFFLSPLHCVRISDYRLKLVSWTLTLLQVYINRRSPNSINSWYKSHILEHEFFCLGHLGSSGQEWRKQNWVFLSKFLFSIIVLSTLKSW